MAPNPPIADTLRVLTGSWQPARGVSAADLVEARRALGAALAGGIAVADIRPLATS
jgi:hypothetical protein